METFEQALESLINRYSLENQSNTPDFILAQYILGCLGAFTQAVRQREKWYGRGQDKAEREVLTGEPPKGET